MKNNIESISGTGIHQHNKHLRVGHTFAMSDSCVNWCTIVSNQIDSYISRIESKSVLSAIE